MQTVKMYSQDPGMDFRIEKLVTLLKKPNSRRNRFTKSRKIKNACIKGKLQVLCNIRNGYIKKGQMVENIRK